jgi:hypothetical protein
LIDIPFKKEKNGFYTVLDKDIDINLPPLPTLLIISE